MKTRTFPSRAVIGALLAVSASPAFSAAAPVVQLTPDAVNSATLLDNVDANASPAAVLRAQVLLDRACSKHFVRAPFMREGTRTARLRVHLPVRDLSAMKLGSGEARSTVADRPATRER